MKGLELSEAYYKEYGEPMLLEQFPDLLPYLAVGLFGSGSECLGYDDETSEDHDFEPGFCIMLPDEKIVDRQTAFKLERAYMKLPSEFMGYQRSKMFPVGGARHGVIRLSDFFKEHTGSEDAQLTAYDWFRIPEQSLLEATNGRVFFDNYGELKRIRNSLSYYPEDIRLKKLAGHLLLMEQSGHYNYQRILKHHENAAAQLALYEFVKSALAVIYLINRRYQPYYKWVFRGLKDLPALSELGDNLEVLIMTDNEPETAGIKKDYVDIICRKIYNELINQGLNGLKRENHGIGASNPFTDGNRINKAANISDKRQDENIDLEKIAYQINDLIQDPEIRTLHILSGV